MPALFGHSPIQRVLDAIILPLPGSHCDRFAIDDFICLNEDEIRPLRYIFDVVNDVLIAACCTACHTDRLSAPGARNICLLRRHEAWTVYACNAQAQRY